MDSIDELEICIIGELWLDETNQYIDLLDILDFGKLQRPMFNLLKKYPHIRNDVFMLKNQIELDGIAGLSSTEIGTFFINATGKAVSVSSLENHIACLREISRRRKIKEILSNQDGILNASEMREIHKLTEDQSLIEGKITDIKKLSLGYGDEIEKRIEQFKNGPQFPTGFRSLDDRIGGLPVHDITVIGGRTSLGKSALMINMACNTAEKNNPTMFFSTEMSEIDILDRIISQRTGIENYKIKFGKVENADISEIQQSLGKNDFYTKPFWICYSPTLTMSDIRRMVEQYKPQVIFIDHIQLLKLPEGNSEAQEISKAMYELKRIAGEYNIAIVVASQLNRGEVGIKSGKLESNNFKGSGGIEEAAAVACKIKMTDETQRDQPEWDIDFEITKNRHGQIGVIKMRFIRKILKFVEV